MSKKAKKISVNQLEKALGDVECVDILKFGDLEIEVKKFISLQDMVQFVHDASDPCFLDDGTYMPEVKQLAFASAMIEHFTNLRLPDSMDKRIAIMYGTDIVCEIMETVSSNQLQHLSDAVDEKIDHMLDVDIQRNRAMLQDAVDQFAKSQEKLVGVFDDLTSEDVKNMASAFSNGSFDEQKLVTEMVKQMQSKEG